MEEHDFFEVVGTQRAMRRLSTEPVPSELIERMLWAATRAPSGGNAQNWRFIVVTEPETKLKLREVYLRGGQNYGEHVRRSVAEGAPQPPAALPHMENRQEDSRTQRSARHLTEHLHEAPVIIIACVFPQDVNRGVASGASIYPAVQNLLLAARALGLGATLTTIHRWAEDDLRELLGIPATVDTAALVPIGWPLGKFGPAPRKPVEAVTYYEHWGERR